MGGKAFWDEEGPGKMARLVLVVRMCAVTQLSTLYKRCEQKSISEQTHWAAAQHTTSGSTPDNGQQVSEAAVGKDSAN